MNHFDAVDFSECHFEEVISFFWRSVYLLPEASILGGGGGGAAPHEHYWGGKHIVLPPPPQ